MSAAEARRRCPEVIVVQPRMRAYSEASKAMFQVFDDASPLVEATTAMLNGSPEFYNLPRKFNISISGCRHDCAHSRANDIGLALDDAKRLVLVTAHRRESFGAPMISICRALRLICERRTDVDAAQAGLDHLVAR